jgi:hypothetical protein
MPEYIFALGAFMAVYAGPQLGHEETMSCARDYACSQTLQFDWSQYDVLVPALEGLHYRKDFWKDWRRSTNVEIAGQGRYRP